LIKIWHIYLFITLKSRLISGSWWLIIPQNRTGLLML